MNLIRPKPVGRFAPAALVRPDSMAVIGAGTPIGGEVMRNLRDLNVTCELETNAHPSPPRTGPGCIRPTD